MTFAQRDIDLPSVNSNVAVPVIIDWDGDEDMDLVIWEKRANRTGRLSYFERVGLNSLVPHNDSSSPFSNMDFPSTPAFVDWDGDGDMDVSNVFYSQVSDS